jgi:hypothetical protein
MRASFSNPFKWGADEMIIPLINWMIHEWVGRVTAAALLLTVIEVIVAVNLLFRNRKKKVLPHGLGIIIDSIPATAILMPIAVCVKDLQILFMVNRMSASAKEFTDLTALVYGFVEIFIPFFFVVLVYLLFLGVWFILKRLKRHFYYHARKASAHHHRRTASVKKTAGTL